MFVRFVSEDHESAPLPTALSTECLASEDPFDPPTAAEQKAYRQQRGIVAMFHALRQIKLHDPDNFDDNAAAAKTAFEDETGDDLNDDLLAAFDD